MGDEASRLLITGATGFIGSRLALYARAEGLRVTAVGPVRTSAEKDRWEELDRAGITLVDATLDQTDRMRAAMEGQHLVIHLAAAQHEAHLPDSHFVDVNVEGTWTLLQLAEQAGVRRVVYGSTIDVYGNSPADLDEASTLDPANGYERSKAKAEQVALNVRARMEVVVARISETYGPGDLRLLKLFRCIQDGHYQALGSGKNVRQPIFIDDLCRALLLLALSPVTGETVVLAGEERITTDEMVTAIGRAVGRPPAKMHVLLWPFKLLGAVSQRHSHHLDFFRRSYRFSTSKARERVGFTSEVNFAEGARRTAEWYRANGLLKHPEPTAISNERVDSLRAPAPGAWHAVKALRVAIAVSLIGFLLSRVDWNEGARIATVVNGPLLVGAIAAMFLGLVISSWKWDWALRLHDLRYPLPFLLKNLSIGFFFNHFLPTTVGGDAYRVVQTLPRDGFRSRALSAVVVERIVGLAALLVLGALGAALLSGQHGLMRAYLYVALAVVAAIVFVALTVRRGWVDRTAERWRNAPGVNAIHHNLVLLRSHRTEWAGLIVGSFAFQIVSIGITFVLFSALATNASPAQCAVIAAMVGLSALVPISINGLGVMEGAFVATAVALRIDYEYALMAAFIRRALSIALAVPCGALWLTQARRALPHASPRELTSNAIPLEADVPLSAAAPDGESRWPQASLLEYTHDAIIIWEMKGLGILYWNQAAERLYGYSRQQAHGKVTHQLLRTEVTGGVTALETALARYGIWIGELRHTTRDGRQVDIEGRLSLMCQQNGRWLVLEVNRDVSDRKTAESERQAMEKQLSELRALIDEGGTPRV